MAILDTIKKGYLSLKTASGYTKLFPHTLASLVETTNGTDVQTELDELNSKLDESDKRIYTTVGSLVTGANDLDGLHDTDRFHWCDFSKCSGAPISAGYGYLAVRKSSVGGAGCLQTIYLTGGGTALYISTVYFRIYANSVWGAWRKLTTSTV